MPQTWYFLLPISLFAIFYILMCSYLVFHAFLSMSDHAFFKKYKVSSKTFCESVSKTDVNVSTLSFFYNDHWAFDKWDQLANSSECKRLLVSEWSDSDDRVSNLNYAPGQSS